ncbi:hypothetical protein V6N11_030232 [Hibiscus sabdariffa]|uniref:Asparaginase n=1 Tax=Hibiscus sabdariffa TaxID=183260 RepID=A0ABR2PK95_9ROSI
MGGWAIAVHGGAGIDPNLPKERQDEAKRLLTRCLDIGISALRSNLPAIDVVELVVRELETDPLFNSGRGSSLTEKGTVEMEASIMDGPKRRCGALSGLTKVKNPVSLARLVMDKSPHSYLSFSGAEEFARKQGVELEENEYFNKITWRCSSWQKKQTQSYSITVSQRLAPAALLRTAATSTGGLMNKMTGRIGDSPIIGAGTYACELCGVSCTGEGEAIIRSTLSRDVAAVMEYKGLNLHEAVDYVIKKRLDEGKAGIIAVSKNGEVACGFNTNGMFRGCATEGGFMEVGLW